MEGAAAFVGFVPTGDLGRARAFYSGILGLDLLSQDDTSIVFDAGGAKLRVVRVDGFEPRPFTVAGWEVRDLAGEVGTLSARDVIFARFMADHDELGIWTAPGGARVAWFRDPDGNLLSLSQGG